MEVFLLERTVSGNGQSPVQQKNGYWLKRVDTGEKAFFENMT
jgi:hypothetical protein